MQHMIRRVLSLLPQYTDGKGTTARSERTDSPTF